MGTEAAGIVSGPVQLRLDELTERAALRSMAIRKAHEPPYGWELYSPFRVVVTGSLDNVAAWLTAAEARDDQPPVLSVAGERADG
ncbi:hypothetical protein BOX37_07660 [Nocardia mangyaensis]|uniref:Uncharacterized protein n=1 Tax=Nocardia mangyaensis TaxID=2213200 RepID=A0A1J0VPC7_9NOCA|nr:hypothetical protein [Nocardia mangyaensis]APE33866.1 hypothetical protein BOX37_07660 [Nocardia mangyaensis]